MFWPHPNLEMGKPGLVGNEKESGVVLAFGSTAVQVTFPHN